jgi:hypothetical protein
VIVDTHILISQILYKYLLKQLDFKLNRLAFAYGNIKPDFINKDIKCSHTLDESLNSVKKYSEELMRGNISVEEFSKSLGVICHFLCDYFCIYHREGNDKKGVFEHLGYELKLHIKLLILLLGGRLKFDNYVMVENSLESILINLQKKYNLEEKSLNRDINYALFAASQISKLVVCSNQLYFEKKETNILEEYQISLVNRK